MSTDVQELQTIDIPFKKLSAWEENVRTTASEGGIEELAASIGSVGLLQSLVVKKAPRGKFAVIAGKRRLLALSKLVEAGAWPANSSIPCRLILDEADLTEVSLAENVQREPMHPADEFLAFQRLIVNGMCIADVAARFGVSEAVVSRRLALARVSPQLLNRYRVGEMNLELLQAFTLTDNHERQEEIWTDLERQPWNRQPHTVRALLSENVIPAHDKRVRFVGLHNYEAEGGPVRRDLFSDEDESGIWVLDPAKLTQLASKKLAPIAETVKSEGWKWVEVQPDAADNFIHKHRRLSPEASPLTPEAQTELEALSEEQDRLQEQLDLDNEDQAPETDQQYARLNEIDDRIESIRESRTELYPDHLKAASGAVVTIGEDGSFQLVRGLLRKEDETALTTSNFAAISSKSEGQDNSQYSGPLVEALTTQKTAAIAAEFAQNQRVALAAVVHAHVLSHFGLDLRLYRDCSCLQISSTRSNLGEAKGSLAVAVLEQQHQEWLTRLPKNSRELWQWCLTTDQDTLLRLLAFCAASSINAVQAKNDTNGRNRLPHADALATALEIDMTRWFTPTAENFFDRISKARITEALTEAGKAPDSTKLGLKKAQFAKIAEFEIAATGWLPKPTRISSDPSDQNEPVDDEPMESDSGLSSAEEEDAQ